MTDSMLLKYARAKDDQDFKWRIAAAMVLKAQEQEHWTLAPESRSLTDWVLANPMESHPTMVTHVSVNSTIAGAITIQNGVVDTSAVPDSDIIFAVGDQWDAVAASVFSVAV